MRWRKTDVTALVMVVGSGSPWRNSDNNSGGTNEGNSGSNRVRATGSVRRRRRGRGCVANAPGDQLDVVSVVADAGIVVEQCRHDGRQCAKADVGEGGDDLNQFQPGLGSPHVQEKRQPRAGE